jgi:uncharacterized protein (DUF2062 family)
MWPLLGPMMVGSIPLGVVAGALAYAFVRKAVQSYQFSRRERLAAIGDRQR